MNTFIHSTKKVLSCLLLAALALSAPATTFRLVQVEIGSGWTMAGTIETDGTVGTLTSANIVSWHIEIKAVTGYSYDRSNTSDISDRIYSDGTSLSVPASEDGFADGGLLGFYHSVYDQVRIADFTGPYADGGIALYAKGSAFDMLPLGQQNGTMLEVGRIDPFQHDVYKLHPIVFLNDVTLTGSITTDGTIGLTRILDWNVVIEEVWTFVFTPSNSAVLADTGISTDGEYLVVTPHDAFGNGNSFAVGFGVLDRTMALLADYSWLEDGQAGYVSPFGMYTYSPLPLNPHGDYVVARAVGTDTLSPTVEHVLLGRGHAGNLRSWEAVDGDPRLVCKFFVPTMTSPIVRIDLDFLTTKSIPTKIGFSVTARAVHSGQFLIRTALQNKVQGDFVDVVAAAALTSSFTGFSGQATGTLADYVAPDGSVTGRIEVRRSGPGATMLPCFEFDQAKVEVTG